MPIRWKLMIAVGGPLLVLLAAWVFFDYVRMLAREQRQTEQLLTDAAESTADIIQSQFRVISQVARSTASLLETVQNPREEQIYEILRRNVESEPVIYGACLALELGVINVRRDVPIHLVSPLPVAIRPPRDREPGLFAPYVFRGGTGESELVRMDIADGYNYRDPVWQWYDQPRRTGLSTWTKPYLDDGGGDAEMVTFSAPIRVNNQFAGVATVDVALEQLRRRALARAPENIRYYIISSDGTFVLAPIKTWIMRETILTIADKLESDSLRALGERMLASERGTVELDDPEQPGSAILVFFAPVPETGWSVAGVVGRDQILAPVVAELRHRALLGCGVIAAVLVITAVMGFWIVRPVGKLAGAVERLSAGDLEARAEGVTGRDELGALANAFNSMVRQLKLYVDALTRETARRQSVESELAVARAIQTSLLPKPFPSRPDVQAFGLSVPARQVGGDWFDYFFLEDGRLAIVVADVAGKGVPAAILMAVTRTLIRSYAANPELARSPGALLDRVNIALARDAGEGMFVTIFLGVYDCSNGSLCFANAGHPWPFILGDNGSARLCAVTTGTVVGLVDAPPVEESHETLAKGDALILYTDGVIEARAPHTGELFGRNRLAATLNAASLRDPEALCTHIRTTVDAFQGPESADDLTVLILRRST